MIDRRLAPLRQRDRDILTEFLDLHRAWDTDFRVIDNCSCLWWGNIYEDPPIDGAEFCWSPPTRKDPTLWVMRSKGKVMFEMSAWDAPIEKSGDFARLVRRFSRPDPDSYAEKWQRLTPFILSGDCEPYAPVTWCQFELLHCSATSAYGFFHLDNYSKDFVRIDIGNLDVKGEVLATFEPGEWMQRMARFGLEGMSAFSDLLNGEPR